MKLSYLKINNHLQFNDIEFKFTYPEGQEKANLPLEKICLIGQSGTGKTVILKFIERILDGIISNNPNKINVNESDYKMVFSFPERGENKWICSESEIRDNKKIIKNWSSASGEGSVINSYIDRIKHVLVTVEPDILASSTFLFEHKKKYEENRCVFDFT